MSIAAALERNVREHVRERLPQVTEQMVAETRGACSRRSGALADSIGADAWVESGSHFTTTIRATAEHARYQDEGTGIYGPEGQRIEPRSAKVLAFYWPAAGRVVFAKSVAGSPATRFWSGESGTAMEERLRSATSAAFA